MSKPIVYLKKKTLYEEVVRSKQLGYITDELAMMFMLLVKKISKKGNFSNYSYIDDMCSQALVILVQNWRKFDETKSQEAFSFYTQLVHNEFKQILNKEKNQQKTRDAIMVANNLNPSYSYSNGNSDDLDYSE